MLNDNIIFLNPMHIPSRATNNRPSRYFRNEPSQYFYCDHDDDFCFAQDDERDYLAAQMAEEERYQNELRRQAYLEAMEKKRKQKIMEEKRRRRQQYLMEVERRRRREEEEQRELERQFMVQLERKRQEKLKAEQMRNQRARALEELKRQEMMRTAKANCMNVDSYPMEEELIQGLDGRLYRVLRPNSSKTNPFNIDVTRSQANNQTDDQELFHPNLNITEKNSKKSNAKTPSKKNKKKRGKVFKSSVLIGEVEDASDSECEEEFKDCWHTRRPQTGEWIEPVENMKSKVAFN